MCSLMCSVRCSVQVNLSCVQQVEALGALLCILQKHALLAGTVSDEDGDGGRPVCVVESISEVRETITRFMPAVLRKLLLGSTFVICTHMGCRRTVDTF